MDSECVRTQWNKKGRAWRLEHSERYSLFFRLEICSLALGETLSAD